MGVFVRSGIGPRGDWMQCSIVLEKPGNIDSGTSASDVPSQADGDIASKQSDLRISLNLGEDRSEEERRGDEVHTTLHEYRLNVK